MVGWCGGVALQHLIFLYIRLRSRLAYFAELKRRQSFISLAFQVVSNCALLADGEVTLLTKIFNDSQGFSLGDFMAEVCDQKADKLFLVFRASSGGLAKMLKKLAHPIIYDRNLNLVFR